MERAIRRQPRDRMGTLPLGQLTLALALPARPLGILSPLTRPVPIGATSAREHATLRLAPAAESSPPPRGPLPTEFSTWSIERTTTGWPARLRRYSITRSLCMRAVPQHFSSYTV